MPANHVVHGLSNTPIYGAWKNMIARCHNPKNRSYYNYGARGIRVCAQWHGVDGLRRFIAHMGPRPAGHTLDRIDNDGHYEPGNVRWASRTAQQGNTRRAHTITHEGHTRCAKAWARALSVPYSTFLHQRFNMKLTMEEICERASSRSSS